MSLGLVLTGEIQVDIRLLVSLESQERLKRNIKSVFMELFSAHRAQLVRHIDSRLTGIGLNLITVKVHIMAFAAIIMGAQGVNLRDSRHSRHKGASYGSTGAYQVSILHRLPYQLLRNDVHYGKSVFDNGVQFLLQSCLYDLWQIGSIDLMGPVVTDLRQCLITVRNDRRTLVRSYRTHDIDSVGNLICIGDKLDVIKEYEKGEFPIGNVMLTSVGEALKSITDSVEIDDYYVMIKQYLVDKGVKFAEEHDYYAEINGDELTIHRRNP